MQHGATLDDTTIEDDGSLGPVYDWGDAVPESRHEEMLRQDRNRLIMAGAGGLTVALLMIAASWIWVTTLRKPVGGGEATATPASTPAAIGDRDASAAAEKAAIEAKLRALAPHESLAVTPVPGGDQPKRVRSERIATQPQ